MSRGGSSGGGRSSLGYLFEPEDDITWIHHTTKPKQETQKAPAASIRALQDDKVEMVKGEADQEPYRPAPLKKEDSNPIVSHRPASNIYHTNQLGKNSGLLITDRPSTRVRCAPGGPSSLGFLFEDEHN